MDPAADQRSTNHDGILIRCCFDAKFSMFRVLEGKGKALSSGGFGVSISSKIESSSSISKPPATASSNLRDGEEPPVDIKTSTSQSCEYLFVEEVLFLFERGLLECLDEDQQSPMQSTEMYRMLLEFGISLPIYLVYSHLRAQDFRVLRHNSERFSIIIEQEKSMKDDTIAPECLSSLRKRFKSSVVEAPVPRIDGDLKIAWDAYNPSSEFAKTHPGLPDFYVAATFYNESHVKYSHIAGLMTDQCHGIPLKLATVSDSGTVVMFGISDIGVPSISKQAGD